MEPLPVGHYTVHTQRHVLVHAMNSIQFNIWVHPSNRFHFMHFLFCILFYILILFQFNHIRHRFQCSRSIHWHAKLFQKKCCIWIAAAALMKCSWFYIQCFDVCFLAALCITNCSQWHCTNCVVPFRLPQQFNSIQCNSPSAQFITLCHFLIECDSLATVLIATHHNSSSSLSSQYSIKFSQIWSSPQQQHRRQTTKQQTTKNRIAYINRYCRLLNHCDKSFSLSIAIIIIVPTKLNMLLPVLLSLDCGFTTWSSMVI